MDVKDDSKKNLKDERIVEIIGNYSWGAFAALVVIPIPGADVAAAFGVWGKMIYEIARVYGHEPTVDDCYRLASNLFKSVILATAAWFGSAKAASAILKFIPGAGTLAAYVIDAVIAAIGAKGITARLGTAAALYYKSNRRMAPEGFVEHVKTVVGDPRTIRSALALVVLGTAVDVADDLSDVSDDLADAFQVGDSLNDES